MKFLHSKMLPCKKKSCCSRLTEFFISISNNLSFDFFILILFGKIRKKILSHLPFYLFQLCKNLFRGRIYALDLGAHI